MNKWVALPGVGNGDGSDLSMEIRLDGLLIYECKFGDNINCQVSKLYYRKKEVPDQSQYCPYNDTERACTDQIWNF